MALEPIGNSFAVEKLKEKLKKRFPEHNFDIKAEPDRKHKLPTECGSNKITYYDNKGNVFCGQRYKKIHEDNPYSWEWATCNALIREGKPKFKQEVLEEPF
tara:strand:+ start:1001 stop:1303 length:303 start_codon:yes stop_codon:yes gene_type:complete